MKSLPVKAERVGSVTGAAARLHNFVIDDDTITFAADLWSTEDFSVNSIESAATNPGVLAHNEGHPNTLSTTSTVVVVGEHAGSVLQFSSFLTTEEWLQKSHKHTL